MTRSWLALLLVVASGCAMTWGGPDEHRPAIQQELDASLEHRPLPGWKPDPRLVEQGIAESIRDGGPPRDDAASWRGPASTIGASATGERPGVSNRAELAARAEEHSERVAKRVDERNAGPEPRPADVEKALETWEQWKAEHGFSPIDLSPSPTPTPPPPKDKRGP